MLTSKTVASAAAVFAAVTSALGLSSTLQEIIVDYGANLNPNGVGFWKYQPAALAVPTPLILGTFSACYLGSEPFIDAILQAFTTVPALRKSTSKELPLPNWLTLTGSLWFTLMHPELAAAGTWPPTLHLPTTAAEIPSPSHR